MDLLWPVSLVLLGLIPALIAAYIWILRRRRRFAVRFSSLALVRAALPRYSRLRRHLPFALFLIALASLVIALSRPVAIVTVPTNQATIILTVDVSRSMLFNDVPPSRLAAAQDAALAFIQRQSATTEIGIVAFSGFADMILPPTTDKVALQAAIESLTTGRATAIGAGILKSLDAISQVDESVAPSRNDTSPGAPPAPVPKGAYAPDIVVLLTDGVSNAGPLPLTAAQQAADRGVRVYTIGFGTEQGPTDFGGGDPFGGRGQGFGGGFNGGGGGFGFRRGIDEATLKQVSAMTGGEYYPAASAGDLQNIFQNLPTYLIAKHETTEISVIFAAIGGLLTALAVGLALTWHPLL